MTTKLYVLKLQGEKYYVGRTDDVLKRLEQHKIGKGSVWTKKYPPIDIIETRNNTVLGEDNLTKEYMIKYGIDNVRGGQYSQIVLPVEQLVELEKTVWHEQNACLRCGRTSHYISNCYAKTTIAGRLLGEKSKSNTTTNPINDSTLIQLDENTFPPCIQPNIDNISYRPMTSTPLCECVII